MNKLILTAVAKAQAPQTTRTGKTRLDGWGFPLQTIYLWDTGSRRFQGSRYSQIEQHQLRFYDDLVKAVEQETDWFYDRCWNQLPKIFNDPVPYTLQEIIDDTRNHYLRKHDPCLSILLRQQYLVDRLAEDLGQEIVDQYGIEIKFRNPAEPVLDRFWSKIPAEPRDTLF